MLNPRDNGAWRNVWNRYEHKDASERDSKLIICKPALSGVALIAGKRAHTDPFLLLPARERS